MRLLVFCHNHPDLQPGGTEVVARGLFRELRDRHGVEGLFLAAVTGTHRERRPGTLFQAAGPHPDELLVWLSHFDRYHLAQLDTWGLAELLPMVEEFRPDIVHFHHILYFGLETLELVRRAAPRAKLLVTLHDYFAICPQEGQLLTADGRLCDGPSLDACRRCFPARAGTDHVLRELAVRGAFRGVDVLVAPSDFLQGRFVAAGWEPGRFRSLRNGIAPGPAAPPRPAPDGRRDRFAFFGHINRFKGATVAVEASARLTREGVAHGLALHGGTAHQPDEFLSGFRAALAAAPDARHHGLYAAADMPRRIAEADWVVVPSIWWENAPLVVQEAFRHGRPVICGDVGGMAEAVRDGVDGLHVPPGDPAALAAMMRRAAEEPGLWERLRAGIRPPRLLAEAAEEHMALYRSLLGEGTAARAAAGPPVEPRPADAAPAASRPAPRPAAPPQEARRVGQR